MCRWMGRINRITTATKNLRTGSLLILDFVVNMLALSRTNVRSAAARIYASSRTKIDSRAMILLMV